jgi:hypothetical protein
MPFYERNAGKWRVWTCQIQEISMEPGQTSSKREHQEPIIPPVGAEELYRRYLRLRAKEDLSRNTMTGVDLAVTKLREANSEDGLS